MNLLVLARPPLTVRYAIPIAMAVPGTTKRTNSFDLQGTSLNIEAQAKNTSQRRCTVAVQYKHLPHNKWVSNLLFHYPSDSGLGASEVIKHAEFCAPGKLSGYVVVNVNR